MERQVTTLVFTGASVSVISGMNYPMTLVSAQRDDVLRRSDVFFAALDA